MCSPGAVKDPKELMLSLREVESLELKFCRVCSVRADTENIKLTALISAAYGVDVEYAQSKNLAGVTNGYKNAAQLGVDRWLVVVAAYAKTQTACMVIDCGTAITVDYIGADGVHLGGCIAPGLRLMSSALNCNTQLVSDVSNVIGGEPLLAGRDTQVAVGLGIRSMLTGFVKEQLAAAEAELGARFVALSTGAIATWSKLLMSVCYWMKTWFLLAWPLLALILVFSKGRLLFGLNAWPDKSSVYGFFKW